LRRLGRAMRFNDGPNEPWFPPSGTGIRSDPAADFDEEWRRHARQVRRLHEKLFYRPLLDAVARLPSEAARLTPAEARARLEAVAIFGDDAELNPRSLTGLRAEMMAAIQRYEDDAEAAVTAVRSVRRRELLRTSAADVLCFPGGNDPPQTPPAPGGTHPPRPP